MHLYHGYERSFIDSYTDTSTPEEALGSEGCLSEVEIQCFRPILTSWYRDSTDTNWSL